MNAFRFEVRSSLAQDFQNCLGVSFQIQKKRMLVLIYHSKNKDNEEYDIYSIPYEKVISKNIREIAIDLFDVGIGKKEAFDQLTIIFLESISEFFDKYQSKMDHDYSKVKRSDIIPHLIENK